MQDSTDRRDSKQKQQAKERNVIPNDVRDINDVLAEQTAGTHQALGQMAKRQLEQEYAQAQQDAQDKADIEQIDRNVGRAHDVLWDWRSTDPQLEDAYDQLAEIKGAIDRLMRRHHVQDDSTETPTT